MAKTPEEIRAYKREWYAKNKAKNAKTVKEAALDTSIKNHDLEKELTLANNKLVEMERIVKSFSENNRQLQAQTQELMINVNATLTFLKEQARMNYTSVLMAIENFQNKGAK